jgi:arylsulfatase A-like enzyme
MRAIMLGLLFGCTGPEPGVPETPPLDERPSILVIVLDTLRADSLSVYGNSHPAPQIEEIAAAGVLFEDVTAPGSWTWPSHAALFTGLPPWESGARHNPDPNGLNSTDRADVVLPMRTDRPTFAEDLSEAGYETVAISANGWLHEDLGLTRGFQTVDHVERDLDVTTGVESLLGQTRDKPLLLFLNYMGAHAPYGLTPAPWVQSRLPFLEGENRPEWLEPFRMATPPGLNLYQSADGTDYSGFEAYMRGELEIPPEGLSLIRDLYESEVAVLERHLSRVIASWTEQYPTGVVILTSDHGEYLGEHKLLEHGLTAFPEVLQVPLIIAAPGRLEAGTRVSTPVQLQDVAGTILKLAGLESRTLSLFPTIEGRSRPGPIQAAAWHHATSAARLGGRFEHDWTYFREGDLVLVQSSDGSAWLYDIRTDPDFSDDLSEARPEQHEQMIQRSRNRWPLHTSDARLTVPDEVREALHALGYSY